MACSMSSSEIKLGMAMSERAGTANIIAENLGISVIYSMLMAESAVGRLLILIRACSPATMPFIYHALVEEEVSCVDNDHQI